MAEPADIATLLAAFDRVVRGLAEVRSELRSRKRRVAKRRGTVAQRSADRVESEPAEYQPTELQRARVRRALLKVPR